MKIRPALLVIEDNKLLVMRYSYSGGIRWNLPGGNLEFGESVVPALKREWKEELNVEVEVGHLLVVGETDRSGQRTLHMVFEGRIVHGIPSPQPEETTAEAVEWIPVEEIENAALYPAIQGWLKSYWTGNNPPHYAGLLPQIWL